MKKILLYAKYVLCIILSASALAIAIYCCTQPRPLLRFVGVPIFLISGMGWLVWGVEAGIDAERMGRRVSKKTKGC